MIKKRNGKIDLLKFIFTVAIVIQHETQYLSINLFRFGFFGVDFFFIVSGYFMARYYYLNCRVKKCGIGKQTMVYVAKKIGRITPNVYIAWAICFFEFVFVYKKNLITVIKDLLKSMPQLLFISEGGLVWEIYNPPMWYISAMILGMMILFPFMMKYGENYFFIISPIVYIFGLGVCFQKGYSNYFPPYVNMGGGVLSGMARGMVHLSAGGIVYKLSEKIKNIRWTKLSKRFFLVTEYLLYTLVILLMNYSADANYGYITSIIFVIAVSLSFGNIGMDEWVYKHKIFGWLGEFSFNLMIGHMFYQQLSEQIYGFVNSESLKLVIYLVLSVLTAMIIMSASKILRDIFSKYKIKQLFIER